MAGAPATDGSGTSDASGRRGRPRRTIAMEDVAEAVGELFVDGGYEAVSISNTAEKLDVSRATLYRTVPTKAHLVGILFERGTRELSAAAEAVLSGDASPRQQLRELIELQIAAAVRMRRYMSVFFGGAGLPPDVFRWWRPWTRTYEGLWVGAVRRAMDAGVLRRGDPVVATRLLFGMTIWVSRWHRPADGFGPKEIAESAINLLGLYEDDMPDAERERPRLLRRRG